MGEAVRDIGDQVDCKNIFMEIRSDKLVGSKSIGIYPTRTKKSPVNMVG